MVATLVLWEKEFKTEDPFFVNFQEGFSKTEFAKEMLHVDLTAEQEQESVARIQMSDGREILISSWKDFLMNASRKQIAEVEKTMRCLEKLTKRHIIR